MKKGLSKASTKAYFVETLQENAIKLSLMNSTYLPKSETNLARSRRMPRLHETIKSPWSMKNLGFVKEQPDDWPHIDSFRYNYQLHISCYILTITKVIRLIFTKFGLPLFPLILFNPKGQHKTRGSIVDALYI